MLRLAAPLALAELGWMAMQIMDAIMAGPFGAAAVGAGILGNMIYYPIVTGGVGLLFGLDTLVAQAFGARNERDTRASLVGGIWIAFAIAPILALLIHGVIPVMYWAGSNPAVMRQCVPYMKALLWGILPLLLFTAFRRYLQAVNVVKPITVALVTALAANFLGNWVLMYGHWGFPRMGLAGSGWSTSISRVYLMVFLLLTLIWQDRRSGGHLLHISWRPDFSRIRRLLALGLPPAGQIAFEGALFGVVSVLASKLDEVSLAAHGLAVQVIATTYMVPLGISSAAAVRVGHAVGRRDRRGVSAAGWAALIYSTVFMGAAGAALWAIPGWIIRGFLDDPEVVRTGSTLLRIAAFFELFDGFQVVTTGALRGLGDTRSPMFAHLVFYWAVGLPVAYLLCFRYGWGAAGIWVGLSAALILIGAALLLVWHRRQKDQSTLV